MDEEVLDEEELDEEELDEEVLDEAGGPAVAGSVSPRSAKERVRSFASSSICTV